MYSFSRRSEERLATCHPDLQKVLHTAIRIMDFTVLQGHRGKEEQNEMVRRGVSQLRYPHSNHNTSPSHAVDIAPWPIDWEDTERFAELAGVVKACAHFHGVKLGWGGDWKSFKDMPHFELKGDA